MSAVGDPGLSLLAVDAHVRGLLIGVVSADLLDETAIAGEAAVSNNNTIEGSLLSCCCCPANS